MLTRITFVLSILLITISAACEIESKPIIQAKDETLWRKGEFEELSYSLSEVLSNKESVLEQMLLTRPEVGWIVPFLKVAGSRIQFTAANQINITNECNADLLRLAVSITQNWTLSLLDSFGKIPSGIKKGNLLWPGDFDQCQSFVSPQTKIFPKGLQGRYCLMSLAYGKTAVTTGVCVPRSCGTSELNEDITTLLALLNETSVTGNVSLTLPTISFKCLPENVPLSSASIGCVILLVIIAGLTAAGTAYDIWKQYSIDSKQQAQGEQDKAVEDKSVNRNGGNGIKLEDKKRTNFAGDFLLCFSALANAKAILDTSSRPGQLNCLHGIRVFSMTWVLLGHTYVFGMAAFANTLDVLKMFSNLSFQVILKGGFAVDTFFYLSGFLVSYLFLKERSAFTLKKLGYFYFHRYVRLTPVYLVILFFYGTVFNFIGDGPYWGYALQEENPCTQHWWRNVFYIGNFFKGTDMCMVWSWYLDNDMQFYIISPLFLVLFKSTSTKKRWLGLAIVLSLLLASWIYTGILVKIENYTVMFNGIDGSENDLEKLLAQSTMFDTISDKPWTRIPVYLIGCLTAVVLLDIEKFKRFFTRISVTLCWLGATTLALACVYGLYKNEVSVTTSAFYIACSSSAWCLCVAWVILACLTKNGGFVDKLLSWKIWLPMSRLTYCGYLIHPIIMYFYYLTLRAPVYITNSFVVVHFLGFAVLTYGLAFVTSVALEAPVIKLEKLIRQRFSR